jgi:hypothetical protein
MTAGPLSAEVVARFLARHRAERLAAGLPERIEDPDTLNRVAAIVANSERRSNDERSAE